MNKKLSPILLVFSSFIIMGSDQEHLWTETYVKAINGFWGEHESASGPGSTLEQTAKVRNALSKIITKFHIESVLDAPCGDFNWMRQVNLGTCYYIGCEIVKPMIADNIKKYGAHNRVFLHLDVTKDLLPQADLIICRDLFVHLSIEDINAALRNFKLSGAKYLLTTIFSRLRDDTNAEIKSGGWRTVNFEKHPFNFPPPLLLINEGCTEQGGNYSDKSLGLWCLDNINIS